MNEIYKLAGEAALVPCFCSDKEIQWTSYKSSGNYGKKGKRECRPFFSIMENINKIPFFFFLLLKKTDYVQKLNSFGFIKLLYIDLIQFIQILKLHAFQRGENGGGV